MDAPSTTPNPAPAPTGGGNPQRGNTATDQTPHVLNTLKLLALWEGLAFAAYNLAMAKLPIPEFGKPWLTVLFVIPIIAAIHMSLPKMESFFTYTVLVLWAIGSLIISVPQVRQQGRNFLNSEDPYATLAYERATKDAWLKFAAGINPSLVQARQELFKQILAGENVYTQGLKQQLLALNWNLQHQEPANKYRMTLEQWKEGVNGVASEMLELKQNNEILMDAVAGMQKYPRPRFGVPWTIWLIGVIWAVRAAANQSTGWGKIATWIGGGLLICWYLGTVLVEWEKVFTGKLPSQLNGTVAIQGVNWLSSFDPVIGFFGAVAVLIIGWLLVKIIR